MNMKRIKIITGYTKLAAFNSECTQIPNGDGDLLCLGEIPRQSQIPSPYAYSPVHCVWEWNGIAVIIVQTWHRRYEVFEVDRATIQPMEV